MAKQEKWAKTKTVNTLRLAFALKLLQKMNQVTEDNIFLCMQLVRAGHFDEMGEG